MSGTTDKAFKPKNDITELRILGDLNLHGFADWICHRAAVLDLNGYVKVVDQSEIRVGVSGNPDLIDAMEAACSLGPANVIVDEILRQPPEITDFRNRFTRL
ncbi:MAG: acylphosphatase [Marinosulfonomonas sp.]